MDFIKWFHLKAIPFHSINNKLCDQKDNCNGKFFK